MTITKTFLSCILNTKTFKVMADENGTQYLPCIPKDVLKDLCRFAFSARIIVYVLSLCIIYL